MGTVERILFLFASLFFSSSIISVMGMQSSSRTKAAHVTAPSASEPTAGTSDATPEEVVASSTSCYKGYRGPASLQILHRIHEGGGHSTIFVSHARKVTSVEYWLKPQGVASLQYFRGSKGGKVEGSSEEINEKFTKYNPFAHVGDKIVEEFDAGMEDKRCASLINYVETHPPVGYEKYGRRWMDKFVTKEFAKKAVKKLRKHGEAVYYDEEG
ncbi:hypothetical protein FOZ63_028765 [Perkinsus olseni]|uniref:Uncharacterized protein n=1 Tax=Perkinsus olseni TaxID=32597 RepID=A0A7J6QLT2_PEROL|nr:hypothetical protein FOZ63_028765 [Perkinsus olseni]